MYAVTLFDEFDVPCGSVHMTSLAGSVDAGDARTKPSHKRLRSSVDTLMAGEDDITGRWDRDGCAWDECVALSADLLLLLDHACREEVSGMPSMIDHRIDLSYRWLQ